MRKSHLRFMVASCVLCLLPVGVQAQQNPTAQPAPQQTETQQQDRANDQGRAGQVQRGDRIRQTDQAQQRGQGRQAGQTQQRGQDRQGGLAQQGGQSQHGDKSVEDFMVKRLILANKAEIELSQMATEKAEHPEVKQFAQTMVQDHQKMLQELEQLKSGGQDSSRTGQSQPGAASSSQNQSDRTSPSSQAAQGRSGSNQPGATSQPGQAQPGQDRVAQIDPGQDRPGQARPGQTQTRQDRPGQTPSDALGQDRPDPNRLTQDRPGQSRMQSSSNNEQIPQQLTQVTERAAERTLQMAKEMLQEADQGKEFDMTFVGMQIVGHTRMVAELEAMRNVGSQQFQQLVSKGAEKTQEHLDMAKQLSKKLSNGDSSDRQSGSQPQSSTPSNNRDSN